MISLARRFAGDPQRSWKEPALGSQGHIAHTVSCLQATDVQRVATHPLNCNRILAGNSTPLRNSVDGWLNLRTAHGTLLVVRSCLERERER